MLKKISLANFKCFEQLDLDCTSLNLLCGLNGMGKSSVIQALLVLRQSFDTGELHNGRLVLGTITDGIAVGFPSDPVWDCDQLTIHFDELLPDERIGEASEIIDNLTRSAHVQPICGRHRAGLRDQFTTAAALWNGKEQAFPNLIFGPEVEGHLSSLNDLQVVVKRLASLNESASEWRGGPMPTWKSKVTPESQSVMDDPRLREARRFRSHRGTRELFEWHARFGSRGRIHLRFDPRSLEVEIGYIGPHLPL